MIRILIIAILAVVLYRLVAGKPLLGGGQSQKRDQIRDSSEGEYTDYEEIDDEDLVR